ncbi:endolytic transglycosylase MltG [Enemella evansiae]|uniref:endolytic transglycosylase MltG n=1 Tax=Enemella evansiae TaxID=2016499 RepID=UPI00113FCD52|nr:endolytic transglycosylase MltG [Enemella evansiae]
MSSLMDPEHQRRNWSEVARHAKSAFAVLLSLAVLVGGGLFAYNKVSGVVTSAFAVEDYPGPGNADVSIEIPQGSTVDEIGSILKDNEVIASTDAFDKAKVEFPNIQQLQAGSYALKTHMRARDAIQAMLDAGVKGGKKFLIREGLRIGEQVSELSRQTDIPEEKYREALAKPDQYGLSSWANGNPEGFLFPDTYEMSGNDPNAALKQMTANFNRKAGEIQLESKAKQLNRSPRDVVIVASIIEAEVRRPEDRAKVARVLYNRLDSGMKLQLDTTVEYANNKPRGAGATTSDEERANPSPYNTYVVPGLPAGPIGAPGKQALEAAANPVPGNWKFFVAVNLDTGETLFADDFNGHQANVKKFQDWCQANPGKC